MDLSSLEIALPDVPVLADLTPEDLQFISAKLRRRSFQRGTALVLAEDYGETTYILQSGLVRVCAGHCAADRVLLGLIGPGEIIGELHAIDGLGHSADVIAATDCACWYIANDELKQLMRAVPDFGWNVTSVLAKRLRHNTEKIALLTTQDCTGRVARQLLIFAHQCGVKLPDGTIEIPLPLTQGDIAALTGASRQRVNEAFAHFRKNAAISTTKTGRILIHNSDYLARRCR